MGIESVLEINTKTKSEKRSNWNKAEKSLGLVPHSIPFFYDVNCDALLHGLKS
jgi:hypothetical protein